MGQLLSSSCARPSARSSAIDVTPVDVAVLELKRALARLEAQISFVSREIDADGRRALENRRVRDVAVRHLTSRRLREGVRRRLCEHALALESALARIDAARATAETLEAIRLGTSAVKEIMRETADVEAVMRDAEACRRWMDGVGVGEPVTDDDVEADLRALEAESDAEIRASEVMNLPSAPRTAVEAIAVERSVDARVAELAG